MTTPEVLPGLFGCSNGSRGPHGLTEALVLDQIRSLKGLDPHQSKEPSLTEAGSHFTQLVCVSTDTQHAFQQLEALWVAFACEM